MNKIIEINKQFEITEDGRTCRIISQDEDEELLAIADK